MNQKKKWLGALSYLISFGLIAWLLMRLDGTKAVEVLGRARTGYLVLAIVLVGSTPFLVVFRWLGIVKARPDLSIRFKTAWRATMLANFLNAFLPSKSGDLAKAIFIRKHAGLSLGVGSVILERLVDLFVLGLLGWLGYFLTGWRPSLYAGAALVAGVAIAVTLIIRIPAIKDDPEKEGTLRKLRGSIAEVQGLFRSWMNHPLNVLLTFFGSLGVWALSCAAVCALILALGIDLPLSRAVSVLPLAVLVGLVPISISGIGPRDAAFVFLLDAYTSPEEATLIGIGYTLLAYWVIALIALPFVTSDLRRLRHPPSSGD